MSGLIEISGLPNLIFVVGFLYVFVKHVLAFYPYLCKVRFDLVNISLECEIKKMCLDTVFFFKFYSHNCYFTSQSKQYKYI